MIDDSKSNRIVYDRLVMKCDISTLRKGDYFLCLGMNGLNLHRYVTKDSYEPWLPDAPSRLVVSYYKLGSRVRQLLDKNVVKVPQTCFVHDDCGNIDVTISLVDHFLRYYPQDEVNVQILRSEDPLIDHRKDKIETESVGSGSSSSSSSSNSRRGSREISNSSKSNNIGSSSSSANSSGAHSNNKLNSLNKEGSKPSNSGSHDSSSRENESTKSSSAISQERSSNPPQDVQVNVGKKTGKLKENSPTDLSRINNGAVNSQHQVKTAAGLPVYIEDENENEDDREIVCMERNYMAFRSWRSESGFLGTIVAKVKLIPNEI